MNVTKYADRNEVTWDREQWRGISNTVVQPRVGVRIVKSV